MLINIIIAQELNLQNLHFKLFVRGANMSPLNMLDMRTFSQSAPSIYTRARGIATSFPVVFNAKAGHAGVTDHIQYEHKQITQSTFGVMLDNWARMVEG